MSNKVPENSIWENIFTSERCKVRTSKIKNSDVYVCYIKDNSPKEIELPTSLFLNSYQRLDKEPNQ